MKRHYTALWLLFLSAFALFAVASAFDMPEIGGHKLKSSEIVPSLTAVEAAADSDMAYCDDTTSSEVHERPAFPVPCDSASKTILFIGDSMLEGLGPRLAAYAEKNGHTLYNVIWYSSTSEVWGRSDKLRHYIDTLHPDYVFVCLGANELFVSDIINKRRGYVHKILSDIDTIPYVWIGPPNWKPDTGINQLVASETTEGGFFLSDGMHFERSRDGAHPTRTSAAAWMDSVARWMPAHSFHPIRMEVPDNASGRAKRIFVHQPSEK